MDLRTYLEIEDSLARRLSRTWKPLALQVFTKVQDLVAAGDWAAAYAAAQDVDLSVVGDSNREWIKYMLQAAMVFGAKVASSGQKVTAVSLGSYDKLLSRQTDVLCASLEYNVTIDMHRQLVQLIANQQAAAEIVQKAPRKPRYVKEFVSFKKGGDEALQMVSSLHTSRLAVWGFTAEADVLGITRYQLQAVLDGRTSKYCRWINGKSFEVSDALSSITTILDSQNPDDLRSLHPWPKQTKAAFAEYATLSEQEMVARKMHIPPFHPHCRTLCTKAKQRVTDQGKLIEDYATPPQTVSAAPESPPNPLGSEPVQKVISTVENFKEVGVKLTQEEVDHWNSTVGVSPTLVLSQISGHPPVEVLSKIIKGKLIRMMKDGDIRFDMKTNIPGAKGSVSLNQVYDPFTKVMYMTSQEFHSASPEIAMAWLKRLYLQSAILTSSMEGTAVVAAAASAPAIIAHAQMGFLPMSASEWFTIKNAILDELLPDGELFYLVEELPAYQVKTIKNLLASKDSEALWALVNLPYKINGISVADALFAGFKIDMTLNLDNAAAMQMFKGANG